MPGKNYSPQFKAKVALEAIKGEKTISQIASEFGIHPQHISSWKRNSSKTCTKSFRKIKLLKNFKKNWIKLTLARCPKNEV